MTAAHDQFLSSRLIEHVPYHEPRETDPHYKLFNAAKRRMKRQGLLVCAIDGCTFPGPIELHHYKVEYAFQGGVDLAKFNRYYGLHLDDDAFRDYIEGEGNLEPLCPMHHRTNLGVHRMPEPLWSVLRVWKADMKPPAEAA